MKTNMGSTDRILRLLAAIVILLLYAGGQITGTATVILGIVAFAFAVTASLGFCPLYWPFHISTIKKPRRREA